PAAQTTPVPADGPRPELRGKTFDNCNTTFARYSPRRANGCYATVFTIRHWVNSDVTIGPRREEDLAAIANATKNPEFQAKLYEVKAAIREVRGAHLQASSFLINKLLSASP